MPKIRIHIFRIDYMRYRWAWVYGALPLILLIGFCSENSFGQGAIKHRVRVSHPALPEEESKDFDLWELRTDSTLEGYYLDTESVICFDHICKVVPVRIFWDALGSYQKYSLAEGLVLEKKEGEPFLPEDYTRLHEILQDKSSPYKDLSYYEITHERVRDAGEADAVTGPSPTYIDEKKTVRGAAWTCFTLWHWANGELVLEVQRLTGKASKAQELLVHVQSQDAYRQLFAINEWIRRKQYDSLVVETLVYQASLSDSDRQFFKRVLFYLEQADPSLYYSGLKKLLDTCSSDRKIGLWNSLSKHHTPPVEGYFDQFWDPLIETGDYQEINLFLTILEENKTSTPALIQRMIPLLEGEYSIINRRIYWYLSEQKLSKLHKQMLKSFHDRYSDYL